MGNSFLYFPIFIIECSLACEISLSESLFITEEIKPEKHATVLVLTQVIW